jgi:ubiquitin-conjugating enzyme E2 G1
MACKAKASADLYNLTQEYPLLPPKMKFLTPMWHPNVYEDGVVCISILHAPGTDEWGYEDAGERWMPVHTVESIVSPILALS